MPPTKARPALPSLPDLESIRDDWIKCVMDDGSFDAACRVTKYLGQPITLKNYVGDFHSLIYAEFKFLCYEFSLSYIPALRRPVIRTTLIAFEEDTQIIRLTIDDPPSPIDNSNFIVPGKWQDTIYKLDAQVRKEQDDEAAEKNLARTMI